jgi:hypothetical protein
VSRSVHTVRIVVGGAITAIADCILRRDATDTPSDVSVFLQGKNGGPPFGTSSALFAAQCETIEVSVQELNITRAHVCSYFRELNVPDRNEVFSWEKENYIMTPERSSLQFVAAIGSPLCCPANVFSLTGETPGIIRAWPEFQAYRDICFWFKYVSHIFLFVSPHFGFL